MNKEEKKVINILKRRTIKNSNFCDNIGIGQIKIVLNYISKLQEEIEAIKEYINSPEFLDWNLGFKLIDELEYRKDRINKLLGR